ncbi:MAG: hypothetical protein RQ746_16160, partial [Bacteroidales bacterium]|nr:hypothetical protein [Bacteroidales bacterium]
MIHSTPLVVPVLPLGFLFSCNNNDEPIYDEAEVPSYVLPDLLVTEAGDSVNGYEVWNEVENPKYWNCFQKKCMVIFRKRS